MWERYRAWMDQHVDLIAAFLAKRDDIDVADARTAPFVGVHDENALRITLDAGEMIARFVERR